MHIHARWSIRTAVGKDSAEDAVGDGNQLELKFSCGAASLFHQGRIQQKPGTVHKWAGDESASDAASWATRLWPGEILVQLKVAPKFPGVRITPFKSLAERDKKFFTEKIEQRDGKFQPRLPRFLRFGGFPSLL